ncbi:Inversin [Dactylella cylindrospora]|nr:Inversin [Dactylella cylindrospora]
MGLPDPIFLRWELADFTCNSSQLPQTFPSWDHLAVRETARQLRKALNDMLEALSESLFFPEYGSVYKCPIHYALGPDSKELRRTHYIYIRRLQDWDVVIEELEAMVGLWAWSITHQAIAKQDPSNISREGPNRRLFGICNDNIQGSNIKLPLSKELQFSYASWMTYEPEELEELGKFENGILYSKDQPGHVFGSTAFEYFCSGVGEPGAQMLSVETDCSIVRMCAQDIYMMVLRAIFQDVNEIDGKTEVYTHKYGAYFRNSRVEELCDKFVASGLGSQKDAEFCVFPVLFGLGKIPKKEGLLAALHEELDDAIMFAAEWERIEKLIKSACDIMVSKEETATVLCKLFCQAMQNADEEAQDNGLKGLCYLLHHPELKELEVVKHYCSMAILIARDNESPKQQEELLENGAIEIPIKDYSKAIRTNEWEVLDNRVVMEHLAQKDSYNLISQDKDGRTALSWAAQRKDLYIFNLLLVNKKVDASLRDKFDRGAISYAAESGFVEGLRKLLSLDIESARIASLDTGMTPLMFAAAGGHEECTNLLATRSFRTLKDADSKGYTALMHAIIEVHKGVVRILLEHGSNIDHQNSEGETPLHLAVMYGNENIVRMLLDRGAEITRWAADGRSALEVAHAFGRLDILELIFERTTEIMHRPRRILFLDFCKCGRYKVASRLLDQIPDEKRRNSCLHSALYQALNNGESNAVENILDWGRKSNLEIGSPEAAFRDAVDSGMVKGIYHLLEYLGAEFINYPISGGESPLGAAVRLAEREIIQTILPFLNKDILDFDDSREWGRILGTDEHRDAPHDRLNTAMLEILVEKAQKDSKRLRDHPQRFIKLIRPHCWTCSRDVGSFLGVSIRTDDSDISDSEEED